jgi:hypothetical protein
MQITEIACNDRELQQTVMATMIALSAWTKQIKVSSVTVWRWRKKKWLKTIDICGKPYVTREAVLEFQRRAELGEFAKIKDSTKDNQPKGVVL